MSSKRQKSYSIFCCFCEEPRRKRDEISQRTSNESNHRPKAYNIDTNSTISYQNEKIQKSHNSHLSLQKPNNDSTIKYQNDDNSIKNSPKKDVLNNTNSILKKKSNVKHDKKTNISYHTMNENMNKFINKNSKNENSFSLRKRNSTKLENLDIDIDIYLQNKNKNIRNNINNNKGEKEDKDKKTNNEKKSINADKEEKKVDNKSKIQSRFDINNKNYILKNNNNYITNNVQTK